MYNIHENRKTSTMISFKIFGRWRHILFLKFRFRVCRRPIMHEALIMPSRDVAIFIHTYEIVLWQLMSLAMTKLPRPIFFWKLPSLQNYAVANDLTPASAQNTSLLHFLYKIINTIVCLITCPKSSNKIKL